MNIGIGIGIGMSSMGGGFVPTDINGVMLWLRADSGITLNAGNVSSWADLSGNGRNATQGTPANRPPYSAAGAPGGGPFVGPFDGIDDMLVTSGFAASQPIDLFVVAIVAAAGSGGGETVVDGTAVNTRVIYAGTADASINAFAGANLLSAQNSSLWHRIRAEYNGVSSGLTVDDNARVGGDVGSAAATGLTVGTRGGGSNPGDCSVAEIIMYNRILSAAEAAQVQNYLKGRYGI